MTVGIDVCLQLIEGGIYDIEISNYDGDIHSVDFFDTAIIVSLFAERRANESEVPVASMRRGWIGNEATPGFEIGSKIWIYEQARLTRSVLNGLVDAARQSLQWMVDGGYALSIDEIEAVVTKTGVGLSLTIRRPNSKVEKRYYTLWDNTAIPCENLPRLIELGNAGNYVAANLFTAAGSPNYPVDVIFTVADIIAEATKSGIDTGVGWHKDSTITIIIGTSAVVLGSGGQGGLGAGDYTGTTSRGGGGGGGAPFGLGGGGPIPGDDFCDGDPGEISLGGSGGVGDSGNWGGSEDTDGGDGQDGYAGINLQHDVAIINYGSIIGGAGGGGGGMQDQQLGGDGGSVASGVGLNGEGPNWFGFGGARGNAITTNGYNISWIVTGTVTGDIN